MERKLRAIVVDDMDFCRELLTDLLEDRGYEVISFPNITFCPLFPPRGFKCQANGTCADFYLTDNRMPHMQGLDFLEMQAAGDCRIATAGKAIFSAHWTKEELATAKQLNCKIFHKPYDLAELESWLDRQEQLIAKDRPLVNPFRPAKEQLKNDT